VECVILGATSDLASRKLFPALQRLHKSGELPYEHIVAVSRRALEVLPGDLPMTACTYEQLGEKLQGGVARVWYVALPAHVMPEVLMAQAQHLKAGDRVLLEKPHGLDLASFEQLHTFLAGLSVEVFYIDHYRAKATAESIVTVRLANPLFRDSWGSSAIAEVQVTLAEENVVGDRADSYKMTGAIRDVFQNHALYLLGSVLMEEPATKDAMESALVEAVASLQVNDAVRATYDAETLGDTETYVALDLSSHTERWKNVPISVRVGKGLASNAVEVSLRMRAGHPDWTPTNSVQVLRFRVQPDAGMALPFVPGKVIHGGSGETVPM